MQVAVPIVAGTAIKGVAASSGALATGSFPMPSLAQGAAKTLKFVPQANLANFDPIWGTQYVVRNASAMVWDMLYGVDDKLSPKRQMAESEEVSSDGLTWTFTLREGVQWQDGMPFTAEDVAFSIQYYLDHPGTAWFMSQVDQIASAAQVSEHQVTITLKQPFAPFLQTTAEALLNRLGRFQRGVLQFIKRIAQALRCGSHTVEGIRFSRLVRRCGL